MTKTVIYPGPSAGFSLMEMLVSLTVIMILMAAAFTFMRNFTVNMQDEILQKQLLNTIHFAKREAIAHQTPIGLAHHPSGFLTFLDENEDGVVHDHSQIISVTQISSHHNKIYWRSYPRYRGYLLFHPRVGMQEDNATFWHCHADKIAFAVYVSKTGRTRVVRPNNNGNLSGLSC